MLDRAAWNWEIGQRKVSDLRPLSEENEAVCELAVSPDGEKMAAVLSAEPDQLRVWVDGQLWEETFEKAWKLKFLPDGRPVALVRLDDEWTVGVDGAIWNERFEFAWNLKHTADGQTIAVQTKREMQYSLARNDEPWTESFPSIREYDLSLDGQHLVAAAQVEELPEADIFKFLDGTWSIVKDGVPWNSKYLNVYSPTFAPGGVDVAAQIRLSNTEYTLAENEQPWAAKFGCVWEPTYRPGGKGLVAPVRIKDEWTLAEAGQPIWKGRYIQLWRVVFSPTGDRVAAVVSPRFGRWSMAIDDQLWPSEFNKLLLSPIFAPAGDRVAAAFRHDEQWGIVVDGQPWSQTFDMVWEPVFSPDGRALAAKVEVGGQYTLASSRGAWSERFDTLWDPIFSPDNSKVLVRGIRDGQYFRQVVAATEL